MRIVKYLTIALLISAQGCARSNGDLNLEASTQEIPPEEVVSAYRMISADEKVSSDQPVMDQKSSPTKDTQGIQLEETVAINTNETEDFKLITSVDVKFETEQVAKTIPQLERIALANKGIIIESNIYTSILSQTQINETSDSIFYRLEKTNYGNIIIYIPKDEIYNALQDIAPLATNIDYRTISTRDVAVDLLRASLDKKRNQLKQQRLQKTVDSKPSKLSDAVDAENAIDYALIQQNNNIVKEFSLNRDLKYIKLNVSVYQPAYSEIQSQVKYEEYSVPLSDRLASSFSNGLELLSGILIFFIDIWPITLILIILIVFIVKLRKKRKQKKADSDSKLS